MTAFSVGVNAMFIDRNMAADATWQTGVSAPVAARVMLRKPDAVMGYGESRITSATVLIHVRAGEVAQPGQGDTVTVGAVSYRIIGQPERDSLNLTWRCEAARV